MSGRYSLATLADAWAAMSSPCSFRRAQACTERLGVLSACSPCDPEAWRSISRFPVFLSNYGCELAEKSYATALDLSHSDAGKVTASRALLTIDGMVDTSLPSFPRFCAGVTSSSSRSAALWRLQVLHQPMQLPRPDPTVSHSGSSFIAYPGLPVENPQSVSKATCTPWSAALREKMAPPCSDVDRKTTCSLCDLCGLPVACLTSTFAVIPLI